MNEKVRQYLGYAFGEVLLVVVGLLLALQINNWNENRKEQATLQSYLKSVARNMREDLGALEPLRARRVESLYAWSRFNDIRDQDRFTVDEILFFFRLWTLGDGKAFFTAITSGFDALKNSGVLNRLQGSGPEPLLSRYYDVVNQITVLEGVMNDELRPLSTELRQSQPKELERLQVPVGYDVRRREWFDVAASGVRHVPGGGVALAWTAPQFTFNTSCFSCHVSQLERHYDLATDSYRTLWREPGINCETCHGPAGEHERVFRAARRGERPRDPAIVSTKGSGARQLDDLCSPCHAKMSALTPTLAPGEPLHDNFDLVTFENPDYYPDGRDLGENYTYTSWLMSPCVKSGKLDCMLCHTSSELGGPVKLHNRCSPAAQHNLLK